MPKSKLLCRCAQLKAMEHHRDMERDCVTCMCTWFKEAPVVLDGVMDGEVNQTTWSDKTSLQGV